MAQQFSMQMAKYFHRLNEEAGFTLVELLLVLAIISVILLIAVPPALSAYETKQKELFFDLLEADLLNSQSYSMQQGNILHLIFREDHYFLYNPQEESERIIRYYPNDLRANNFVNTRISFNQKGSVIPVTTLILSSDVARVKLVFPLGKGRFYVEES